MKIVFALLAVLVLAQDTLGHPKKDKQSASRGIDVIPVDDEVRGIVNLAVAKVVSTAENLVVLSVKRALKSVNKTGHVYYIDVLFTGYEGDGGPTKECTMIVWQILPIPAYPRYARVRCGEFYYYYNPEN